MLQKIALAAAAFALMSACAVAATPAAISSQQASVIEASCTTIMGLQKGEFQYVACRDSLSGTAAGLAQGQARLAAYDACHGKGLASGSAALATCMLDNEQAAPMRIAAAGPMALPHGDLKAGSSYFGITHDVQWRREQYSCAQLGLVPGSAAFTHCVVSLDADVQATSTP